MVFLWFITFLLLLVIEIVTINLVTIWFAVGAIAALVASLFTDVIVIQLALFLVVSLICLVVTKPLMKKIKAFDVVPTNSDRVLGKIGEVITPIEKNKYGEVKIYGNIWTATSEKPIEVGSKVRVLAIEGVKLIVKKEDDE